MTAEILIVDDEADIRMLLAGVLEDEGYITREASSDDAALMEMEKRCPALVLQDIWLEGSRMDGLGLAKRYTEMYPDLPVIMISGHGTIETAVQAMKNGAFDFIEKPFKTDRLLLQVERAIETARLKRENAELRLQAPMANTEILGNSARIQTIRKSVEKLAPVASRVLISGPAGSGKGLVARAIHDDSPRATAPFVTVHCANLKSETLEEELFGREASKDGQGAVLGLLEKAHGGTLLLDEVGDMPSEVQGKITRMLADRTFVRVGGNHRVEVDVRVMATTSRDLQEDMSSGRFRSDLFYRLNVMPLDMPALSTRLEDIPVLAEHFMQQAARFAGLAPRVLSQSLLAALQSYAWPGNVRQLRNVMEWLLIMGNDQDSAELTADMLPSEIRGASDDALSHAKGAELMALPLREAREIFERDYLMAQVNRFGGNISRTSTFVGMERSALHRKLKSLGVNTGQIRQSEDA
ncbi:MAG: sigma-54 dependent transcriptional regulator [Alphaproteobacteria bacterium]